MKRSPGQVCNYCEGTISTLGCFCSIDSLCALVDNLRSQRVEWMEANNGLRDEICKLLLKEAPESPAESESI